LKRGKINIICIAESRRLLKHHEMLKLTFPFLFPFRCPLGLGRVVVVGKPPSNGRPLRVLSERECRSSVNPLNPAGRAEAVLKVDPKFWEQLDPAGRGARRVWESTASITKIGADSPQISAKCCSYAEANERSLGKQP
jgi:hypothetical protein